MCKCICNLIKIYRYVTINQNIVLKIDNNNNKWNKIGLKWKKPGSIQMGQINVFN